MVYRPPAPPPADREFHDIGGGVYANLAPRYRPVATTLMIGLIVLVGVLQTLFPPLTEAWMVYGPFVREGEWWRIFTGTLVHSGGLGLHLLMNAYFGWQIGRRIETFVGPWRMVLISVAAAIGSGLLLTWRNEAAVGFSGVLYGWLASWFAFHLTPRFPGLRLSGAQLRSYIQLLVINVAISLVPGISFLAHLGGFVSGFLVALLLGLGRPRGTFEARVTQDA